MNSYVYIILNKVTGDAYIGKANNPKKRWIRHKSYHNDKRHLSRSFEKYGIVSFEFNVIEEWSSETEAYEAEVWMIAYLRSLGAILYNENDGGIGQSKGKTWRLSSETKAKQSIAAQNRPPPTEAQKQAIREKLVDVPLSEEHKRAISLGMTGVHVGRIHSDESRKNMRDAHLGVSLSKEHRSKISAGNKRRWELFRQTQKQEEENKS